jgi:hypothetical protein
VREYLIAAGQCEELRRVGVLLRGSVPFLFLPTSWSYCPFSPKSVKGVCSEVRQEKYNRGMAQLREGHL